MSYPHQKIPRENVVFQWNRQNSIRDTFQRKKIVRQVEINTFAWSFVVSNTESQSEMLSEIRLNWNS